VQEVSLFIQRTGDELLDKETPMSLLFLKNPNNLKTVAEETDVSTSEELLPPRRTKRQDILQENVLLSTPVSSPAEPNAPSDNICVIKQTGHTSHNVQPVTALTTIQSSSATADEGSSLETYVPLSWTKKCESAYFPDDTSVKEAAENELKVSKIEICTPAPKEKTTPQEITASCHSNDGENVPLLPPKVTQVCAPQRRKSKAQTSINDTNEEFEIKSMLSSVISDMSQSEESRKAQAGNELILKDQVQLDLNVPGMSEVKMRNKCIDLPVPMPRVKKRLSGSFTDDLPFPSSTPPSEEDSDNIAPQTEDHQDSTLPVPVPRSKKRLSGSFPDDLPDPSSTLVSQADPDNIVLQTEDHQDSSLPVPVPRSKKRLSGSFPDDLPAPSPTLVSQADSDNIVVQTEDQQDSSLPVKMPRIKKRLSGSFPDDLPAPSSTLVSQADPDNIVLQTEDQQDSSLPVPVPRSKKHLTGSFPDDLPAPTSTLVSQADSDNIVLQTEDQQDSTLPVPVPRSKKRLSCSFPDDLTDPLTCPPPPVDSLNIEVLPLSDIKQCSVEVPTEVRAESGINSLEAVTASTTTIAKELDLNKKDFGLDLTGKIAPDVTVNSEIHKTCAPLGEHCEENGEKSPVKEQQIEKDQSVEEEKDAVHSGDNEVDLGMDTLDDSGVVLDVSG